MNPVSRRSFLQGVAAGGTALLTFNQLLGYNKVFGQTNGDDAQTILNLAATSEMYATTHYYTVLTESTIALTPGEIETLKGFLDAELQHLEYLFANNAEPVTQEFYIPEAVYNDREQFASITEQIETAFVGAYLAGCRQFAALGQPLLAGTAAQVASIEQEHLALVRQIGGLRPNNASLGRALFYNVSDAVPALQPFFEGGSGYSGPIMWPGADAIRDLVRDVGVTAVAPFTDTSVFGDAVTEEAAAYACVVASAGNYRCNLRSGPGLRFPVVGLLPADQQMNVNGETTDGDGFVWWRSSDGSSWVRSDIVRVVSGQCTNLPQVSA
jgi:hypothetical protein